MNWIELRPVLREKFGSEFNFYNDKYRSGVRRIKICCSNPSDMCSYIKRLCPELDVKLFGSIMGVNVTIHY